MFIKQILISKISIARIVWVILTVALVSACSTVDMPKGTSRGYSTFRFVDTSASKRPFFLESSVPVNRMIQHSIRNEFRKNGLTAVENDADLIVAYLPIIQDNVSTTMIDNYFGYGRSSDKILDLAHEKGAIKGKSPDSFKAGAIIIDLIDAKTNELIYRHYARRDLIKHITDDKRQQRINDVVSEALTPFFR